MPAAEGAPQTLYDKILAAHVVDERLDGTVLLYIGMRDYYSLCPKGYTNLCRIIDRHLVHEVTSPVRDTTEAR